MAVDAVLCLDQEDLDENLIDVKKIHGGGMQDSPLRPHPWRCLQKNFYLCWCRTTTKTFQRSPDLQLKAEKDNAEVRIDQVLDYKDYRATRNRVFVYL